MNHHSCASPTINQKLPYVYLPIVVVGVGEKGGCRTGRIDDASGKQAGHARETWDLQITAESQRVDAKKHCERDGVVR